MELKEIQKKCLSTNIDNIVVQMVGTLKTSENSEQEVTFGVSLQYAISYWGKTQQEIEDFLNSQCTDEDIDKILNKAINDKELSFIF